MKRTVKIKRIINNPKKHAFVIFWKGKKDVAHWSQPSIEAANKLKKEMKAKYTKIDVMSVEDYYKAMKGKYSTGLRK